MEKIWMSDCTLKQSGDRMTLSFREKIELCRLLDKLNVSMIELNAIAQPRVDSLLIKAVCAAVQQAVIAVPVRLDAESVQMTWEALKEGRETRLQVVAPVSSVQMEYLCHRKPKAMIQAVTETLRACREKTENVEFLAEDATRSDAAFLREIVSAAAEAGARVITLCDSAGAMLPEEMGEFITKLRADVPALETVTLGFAGSNQLNLADACAVAAIRAGAREIKAASYRIDNASMIHLARILDARGGVLGVSSPVNIPELGRIAGQIRTLCRAAGDRMVPADAGKAETERLLTVQDSRESILNATRKLGYDLSEEDLEKVWTVFQATAEKKEQVTFHELDAIVAAEAMQVPPAYTDINYVINTGNTVGAMAHMKLQFHEKELEGISVGDGVIDVAFLSIEQATGRHFELEDFQVSAISEGRQSLGETLVKLRSDGKLYSGRGISTDIVGASIMAYMNALNKIAYEEETI